MLLRHRPLAERVGRVAQQQQRRGGAFADAELARDREALLRVIARVLVAAHEVRELARGVLRAAAVEVARLRTGTRQRLDRKSIS